MTDWTQGYVSDLEYLPGFYVEQTPAHLDIACMLRAVEPPVRPGEPYTYCELGCGTGETAMAIAAANPEAEVWGFDFNPAHVARAIDLAAKGGLDNMHFVEASFEELSESDGFDLPQFDYVTLHGVWSWVSAENRHYITAFIRRHLKPGGVAYVTYNAQPGWAGVVPLQKFLSLMAALNPDRSDRKIAAAMNWATVFAEAGCSVFPQEMMARIDKEKQAGNLAYLSHDYLNEHWSPCFHADVAGALSAAKLGYVGTANLFENFPDLAFTPRQREIIGSLPPQMAETARDFFTGAAFRRDIFCRGARAIPDNRLDRRIEEIRLALAVPPHAVTRKITIPLGEATMNEGFYGPALDALAEKPLTIGALRALEGTAASTAQPREILGMLVGSRQAVPLIRDADEAASGRVRAHNLALLDACAQGSRVTAALAAAGTGSAMTVRLFDMLAYEAIAGGNAPTEVEALSEAMWTILDDRGDRLRHEGTQIEDPAENRRILREQADGIIDHALPIWRRLGVL
jgi:ubiquinone/menaquinone biosynthesis C-methylase UbiE